MIHFENLDEELIKGLPEKLGHLQFVDFIDENSLTAEFIKNLLVASGTACLYLCLLKNVFDNFYYLGEIKGIWDSHYTKLAKLPEPNFSMLSYTEVKINVFHGQISKALIETSLIKAGSFEFFTELKDNIIKLNLV